MKRLWPTLLLVAGTAHATFCGGYSTQYMITISSANVSGNLSNFPVLISTNNNVLSTTTASGGLLNSTGMDLIFSTDSSCNYTMNWDTETIQNVGVSAMNVWVNVPSLSTASLTAATFYMTLGNSSITTYQGYSTGTWDSNYAGVWHLPNGSTLSSVDSTGANNGTNNNATAGTGQIDGAASSDGVLNQKIATGYAGTLGDLTASAWFKSTGASASNYDRIIDKNFRTGFVVCRQENLANTWGTYFLDPTASSPITVTLADGSWHYITVTRSGSTVTVSGDGGAVTSNANRGSTTLDSSTMNIAWSTFIDNYNPFNGQVDEVRISNIARSANWISTEYNNQSAPITFVTFTPQSSGGGVSRTPNNSGMWIMGGKVRISGGETRIK